MHCPCAPREPVMRAAAALLGLFLLSAAAVAVINFIGYVWVLHAPIHQHQSDATTRALDAAAAAYTGSKS